MDDDNNDIVVLEHLSSQPKRVVKREASSIGPMPGLNHKRQDVALRTHRKRAEAEKAERSRQEELAAQCEKYLREYFVKVSTKPSVNTITILAKNVVKWFSERTLPEAFDAEMSKLRTRIRQIPEFTPAREELEKMHEELISGPKSFDRLREGIKKSALKMHLDPDKLANWLAEEDDYRDERKRDLLSMNLAIYGRRTEIAPRTAYGVTPRHPSLRKSLPFYSVFPIGRIQPVKLNGHEQEMPIEFPQHMLTPKAYVPFAPQTLKGPNPSYGAPNSLFGVPNPSNVAPSLLNSLYLAPNLHNTSYLAPSLINPTNITQLVQNPLYMAPILPTPLNGAPSVPNSSFGAPIVSNPSHVPPKKDFSIDSILGRDLLREVAASHPTNETIKLAMQVLGIQPEDQNR